MSTPISQYLTYFAARWKPVDPLTPRGLNPQPLPPREAALGFAVFDPLGPRALNPQPLPPKALGLSFGDSIGPAANPAGISAALLLSKSLLF